MLYITLCFFLAQQGNLDTGGALTANQAAIDNQDLRLVLRVEPARKTISGFSETRYGLLKDKLAILELELVDTLKVTRVRINGADRPYKHGNHKLMIQLAEQNNESILVRIEYEGHPWEATRPPWSGGFNWSLTDAGKPWVGVSAQGEGGQVWFPSKGHQVDKFDSVKLEITIPEPLYCASNGLLQKIETADTGWRTFHWYSKYPIASYNVSINVADYQIWETTYKGEKDMPLILYMLKEYQHADQVSGPDPYETKIATLQKLALDYLTVFSKYYGEFPFIDEKFALAHTAYLGMEHQTINSYGGHFKQQGGVDGLMIHEMAHEWWGNKLTVGDLADFWVQEGICSYTTGVYLEERKGLEAALLYFRSKWELITNSKPVVPGKDLRLGQVYNRDIYAKGALVMHALRFLLGKASLDQILRSFVTETQNNHSVDTRQLIALAERISGQELDWFFQVYIYEAAPPQLTSWEQDGKLHMSWQTTSFQMPLEIAMNQNEVTSMERVTFREGKAELAIPDGASYQIDPRKWVYKTIKLRDQ